MEDIRIKRLEVLKDALIMNYLTEIDFNNKEERALAYDTLLYKTLVEGEFDDIFLSEHLEGLEKEERQRILDLSRKYNSLCFYHGDFDNWVDSIEGVNSSDYNMIAEVLLSNYDYLIRLAKNGGEEVLRFLNKFQSDEEFKKGAVIALLRPGSKGDPSFDDILETILIELSKEDGKYNDFTETQKIIMCNNIENVLCKKDEKGQYEIITVEELKDSILGDDDIPINNIDSNMFRNIIEGIHSYIGHEAVYKK